MPGRVFVDTGAWFAAQVRDDTHHVDAAGTLKGLIALPVVLVTTNHVVYWLCAHASRAYPLRVRLRRALCDRGVLTGALGRQRRTDQGIPGVGS